MKMKIGRAGMALLILCFVLSVFYLREASQPEQMNIPVKQVFSYVASATPSPSPVADYQMQREQERTQSMAALERLLANGDENAGQYLLQLIERGEKELAIESALAAAGYADAVCAVRKGAVTVCVQQKVEASQAQWIIELCEKITGECAENVFLLDENGYSW